LSNIEHQLVSSAADLPWKPKHPGYFVKKDILEPKHLTQEELAKHLGVSRGSINELVGGKRELTIEMARRLAELTGQSEEYWVELNTQYELWHSRQEIPSYGIERLYAYG
jgi:addiction module HigA family antidote